MRLVVSHSPFKTCTLTTVRVVFMREHEYVPLCVRSAACIEIRLFLHSGVALEAAQKENKWKVIH